MFHHPTLEHLHQIRMLEKCKDHIKVAECEGHPVLEIVQGEYWEHLHNTGLSDEDNYFMDLMDIELFTRVYLPTN
jgi:hypothetical protein